MEGSSPPVESGRGRGDSLPNYQFTFVCSASNSGASSTIEADQDTDSCFDRLDSQSLTDSILDYPEMNGRTYHAYRAGSYLFPNDKLEQERQLLESAALTKLVDGRLFFAPLSQTHPPRSILDVATGTGDWAIQMGDLFPTTNIVATDLSPIQPDHVPPNVNFYIEDSSEPWEYSEKFDYIHTRTTNGSWACFEKQIAAQAFDALSPGGWFESMEFDASVFCDDGTLPPDGPLSNWFRDIVRATEACDRQITLGARLTQIYEEAGFVDIHERIFKIPLNGWPKDEKLKEIGKIWLSNFQSGLSGFCFGIFNRAFGRSAAEIEVALVDVRRELADPRIHAYLPLHVVWGRKPSPKDRLKSKTKSRK